LLIVNCTLVIRYRLLAASTGLDNSACLAVDILELIQFIV